MILGRPTWLPNGPRKSVIVPWESAAVCKSLLSSLCCSELTLSTILCRGLNVEQLNPKHHGLRPSPNLNPYE